MKCSQVDVAVAGSGLAGIACALAAASCGARVMLLEQAAQVGGNFLRAGVHTLCGLFHPVDTHPEPCWVHAGLPRRMAESLQRHGAAEEPVREGRVFFLPVHPGKSAAVVNDWLKACPGLRVKTGFATRRIEANQADFEIISEAESVRASALVDTTGSATAIQFLGLTTRAPDVETCMQISYVLGLGGIDPRLFAQPLWSVQASLILARHFDHDPDCGGVRFSFRKTGSGEVFLSVHPPRRLWHGFDPVLPASGMELAARCAAWGEQALQFLRESSTAWDQVQVTFKPSEMGIRESRVMEGRRVLTADDLIGTACIPDGVAWASWPMERWPDENGAQLTYLPKSRPIPRDVLLAKGNDRVAAAGRCLSATPEACSSIRVLGTAMGTGQAAGAMAALAVDRAIPMAEVLPSQFVDLYDEWRLPFL